MSQPIVSIICLCYNHQDYVTATLASVWQQDYKNIEVLIVDDGSTDKSVGRIRSFLAANPCPYPCKTLFIERNIGNCAAFNRAWRMAKGKYVVDLATDDIILPKRISSQVNYFEQLPEAYGVVFTESQYIDAEGNLLKCHFGERYKHIRPVPTGDIYKEVIARYFISSPTMMYKNEVLHYLNGYDEALAYEDFDFWVRSARKYKYDYLDECTTLVRKINKSMSTGWYKIGDRQLYSTFQVCQKAKNLNRTPDDREALAKRVKFEIRQAVFSDNRKEATLFFGLLNEIYGIRGGYKLLKLLNSLNIRLRWLRKLYMFIRY
ncbi:glycosyltransferase involved in cell wall biosynthesis [Catalinimonas alkaloidigena]|uniref:glycosyltransferase family 2 protein n=1 Tax=Catalinimonas alkaloidigena TaxID=1075417 RepID=UPI0024076D8B|nr:glycosyltransferase [Catalinimonas alkaloidigena]MDF9800912.1 glycosyltransferase involved in cell wall biosynthesis [Catalinimonas alkaloidigena]